jgi:cell division protein FtsZ
MVAALRVADDVLRQGVQAVCDLVTVPGLINLDLADVRTVMTGAGTAHMGVGRARGDERGPKAAETALHSAMLDTSIEGARGILINVSGGRDLTLHEITEVADAVAAAAESDATLIFGAVVDEELDDSICVTVVAAGFDSTNDGMMEAQVEGTRRPARRPEVRTPEPRSTETRPSEGRPTERKRPAPDYGEISWERSEEPETTPRKRSDDDLDVPSFLR